MLTEAQSLILFSLEGFLCPAKSITSFHCLSVLRCSDIPAQIELLKQPPVIPCIISKQAVRMHVAKLPM